VNVGIAKFELVDPYRSIVIGVRIGELGPGLVWDVMNGYGEAYEE
jgi:hypothetical protein